MNDMLERLQAADPARSVALPSVTLVEVRERAAAPLLDIGRSRSMPRRAVLVGVVTAVLVLGALVVRRVEQPVGSVPTAVVVVFMDPSAPKEQLTAVSGVLADAGIGYRYVDKQGALQEFLRIYRDAPEVTAQVTADSMPTSFQLLDLGDGSRSFADVLNTLRGLPGVASVQPAGDPAPRPGSDPSPDTPGHS